MTIVAAWKRTIKKETELVIASDSRLTGGMVWDCGPKIFPMPRGDAVIAFAGHSYYAYPLIMQILHWSEDFSRASNRSLDLTEMKGHMERAFTRMLQAVDLTDLYPPTELEVDFQLLLCGYSWKWDRFYIWTSSVDSERRFTFARPQRMPHGVAFVGDCTQVANAFLGRAMNEKGHRSVDWEPLDAVVKLIKDHNATSIGGPPQLAKVYRHMNTMMYAIPWTDENNEPIITLRGRPLLDYEQTQRIIHDPENHQQRDSWTFHPLLAMQTARMRFLKLLKSVEEYDSRS